MHPNVDMTVEDLPQHVRKAFRNNRVKRVILKPGMMLYTLSRNSNMLSGGGNSVTEWWSPYNPYDSDPGFYGRLLAVDGLAVDKLGRLRELGAYANDRAGTRHVVIGKLSCKVTCFFGAIRRAASQSPPAQAPAPTGRSTFCQFYIPNLQRGKHIRRTDELDLLGGAWPRADNYRGAANNAAADNNFALAA